MTNHAIPATSLSGPTVSRWFGFFPEFRQDSLGFLLCCHSYSDVVKLPMGQIAELFFRQGGEEIGTGYFSPRIVAASTITKNGLVAPHSPF